MLFSMLLCACTADSAPTGSKFVRFAIEKQCLAKLDNDTGRLFVAIASETGEQTEWPNKICGCVGEEAAKQITANDLVQILSPNSRNHALTALGIQAVAACTQRLYQ
ncbi:lipoprotein [Neisseria animalis]|nr:lipoprotein [Neisseria animalis]